MAWTVQALPTASQVGDSDGVFIYNTDSDTVIDWCRIRWRQLRTTDITSILQSNQNSADIVFQKVKELPHCQVWLIANFKIVRKQYYCIYFKVPINIVIIQGVISFSEKWSLLKMEDGRR